MRKIERLRDQIGDCYLLLMSDRPRTEDYTRAARQRFIERGRKALAEATALGLHMEIQFARELQDLFDADKDLV